MNAAVILLATLTTAAAVRAESSWTIRDGAQQRVFTMATGEIGMVMADQKMTTVKIAERSPQAMTALVKQHTAAGRPARLVFYEAGMPRTEANRRWLTGKVIVRLRPEADAAALIASSGAAAVEFPHYFPQGAVLTFQGDPDVALHAARRLRSMPEVVMAVPVLARQRGKRFIPNDPLFSFSMINAGYQWHLRNTGANGSTTGIDLNVAPAWDTWKGGGIRIGIIDDGLETTHPDLSPNTDTVHDYDWNGADDNPSPGPSDRHGTACAGAAAARGHNGVGISGVAPEATLVGMRLIAGSYGDPEEAGAFAHRNDLIFVKSNSWGPTDDGATVEGPGVLASAAIEHAVNTGRSGHGTIFVWAAGNGGNGGNFGDDSNFDGYANSLYTIAVGAVSDRGSQSNYSEPGANLLVCAPSDDAGRPEVTTTDLTGSAGYNSGGGSGGNYIDPNYTNTFGGTSAACPLAAGGIALLLQARPSLGWRDVKEILIRSARIVDPSNSDWLVNAAGLHFNDKYGAGLMDVHAAVALAAAWQNLGSMEHAQQSLTKIDAPVPDNSPAGVVRPLTLTAALRVEQVTLHVNISHTRRGQLEIHLTSPAGTTVRLIRPRPDNLDDLDWTMSTPQCWGESASGTWNVRVRDTASGTTGTLNRLTLTVYGTSPDGDGDGFTLADEVWFGTSDTSALSMPVPLIDRTGAGDVTVQFPSVQGNGYLVESSPDLLTWTAAPLTATSTTTTWTDNSAAAGPRYYRVRRP